MKGTVNPDVAGRRHCEHQQKQDEAGRLSVVRRHTLRAEQNCLQKAALSAREPRRQHIRDAPVVRCYSQQFREYNLLL